MTSKQRWIYDPPPPPPKKPPDEVEQTQGTQQSRQGRGRPYHAQNASRSRGRHLSHPYGNRTQNTRPPYIPSREPYPPNNQHHLQPSPKVYGNPSSQLSGNPQRFNVYPYQPFQAAYMVPQGVPTMTQGNPLTNAYGYTLSSTIYSLPEHHYRPFPPEERPELSEEELRHALEVQMKGKTGLPVAGTTNPLTTVEDIMAWREERRRKWLSKIASAPHPKRPVKAKLMGDTKGSSILPDNTKRKIVVEVAQKSEEDHDSSMSDNESELSEGEIRLPGSKVERRLDSETQETTTTFKDENDKVTLEESAKRVRKKQKRSQAGQTRKERGKGGMGKGQVDKKEMPKEQKSETSLKSDKTTKPRSFYAALLEGQMERENIVLLQVLLHFRDQKLLN